ncbi:glycosyltransferase family 2 protein [Oligoflexaceae bacterium]|nr:glycosyltransferase family 2 protein [Oligoflexaceae bacterium]
MPDKLSLLIPVYNEATHLEKFFTMLSAVKMPCEVEYVFVDDCSSDESWEIIGKITAGREDCLTFRQSVNKGKGAALHKGIQCASGNIIAVQDADFEYDPRDLTKLVQPVMEDKADVVYGSRFHKSGSQVHRTIHYLINRFLTLVSNILSGLYLTDMETCYKVFKAEIIKGLVLESERFGFEPEVTAKLAKLKLRVHEFPIHYHPRNYLEGKKITWKDGVAALWFILKFNCQRIESQVNDSLPKAYIPKNRQWL